MIHSPVRWLESKAFATQIILLAALLDPIGAAGGYLLAPRFGVDPLMGAVYGLVAASMPLSLWVMRYGRKHG